MTYPAPFQPWRSAAATGTRARCVSSPAHRTGGADRAHGSGSLIRSSAYWTGVQISVWPSMGSNTKARIRRLPLLSIDIRVR